MSSLDPLRQPQRLTPTASALQVHAAPLPWKRLGLIPLFLFVLSITLLESYRIDLKLADLLYQLEGGHWALREYWLTAGLIHNGGRWLSFGLLLVTLLLWGLSWFRPALRHWRPGFGYLISALLCSVLTVNAAKRLTGLDCPWSLTRYGADRVYHSLFSPGPAAASGGACFPAGHASAGYAWVALYFVWLHYFTDSSNQRGQRHGRLALLPGLGLGVIFGISQQLRGAHFISHDIWTLAICWFSALILYRWLLWPKPIKPDFCYSRSSVGASAP
ncbi:phosphatase PAP2 family protein [Marinobacterium rhizophilum]|uniref:phosphatase PAP2 family protein n=1 Tax=Marinobacterium rhizophilum TaxID=420402 RepID=UPI00037F9EA0|nr:phosphatase PAP2 family protein [Marinobacterium rhizophilum]